MTLLEKLAHHTGTTEYYRHFGGLLLTEGARCLAEEAGCYWLMDTVALQMCPAAAGRDTFFVVDIERDGAGVRLRAHDGGKGGAAPTCYFQQDVEYSDFPLESYSFYVAFDGGFSQWVAMLPSEY